MAHFNTLVLIESELLKKGLFRKPDEAVNDRMHDLLFAHAAYFPGEKYEGPCTCFGAEACDAGQNTADSAVGPFWSLYREYVKVEKKARPPWRDFSLTRQWKDVAVKSSLSHPARRGPDDDCPHCRGTGIREVDYNLSEYRFDYFNIDGDVDVKVNSASVVPVTALEDISEFEAAVTPNGEWHAVQWDQEDPYPKWEALLSSILEEHREFTALKCHMHI
jgi:hypothetical protein